MVLRPFAVSLTAVSGAGLAASLLAEYGLHWMPCPLCILQRFTLNAVFVLGLALLIFQRRQRLQQVASLAAAAFALAGLAVALWQLSLLWSPQAATCASGVRLWLETWFLVPGYHEMLLNARADCGAATQEVLGLSLPAWSSLLHLGLAGLALRNLRSRVAAAEAPGA